MNEPLFSTDGESETEQTAAPTDIEGTVVSTRDKPIDTSQPFFFDLETIPDWDRVDSFPVSKPEESPRVKGFGRLATDFPQSATVGTISESIVKERLSETAIDAARDNEMKGKNRSGAIAAIEKGRRGLTKEDNQVGAFSKTLATTPEYLRIIAMGWAIGRTEPMTIVVGDDGFTESDLLAQFWALASVHRPIVGYNIIGFDLPAIAIRSAILQVPGRFPIETSSWKSDVIDIFAKRFHGRMSGPNDCGKLKEMATVYGIEVPAGDMEGSQVEETYLTNKNKIHKYVQSDVEITRDIYTLLLGSLF